MLDPEFRLPIECPYCLEFSEPTVAWLKANTGWRCDGCGQDLRYEQAQLQKVLRRAEETVRRFERDHHALAAAADRRAR